ncbi:hypothetical protein BG57_06280 [Caballeronia grimmiae]|uniref:Uncharacterized protein n=1 Tax=Caballeronia grimmiae TaxID=1071679 RepID=A0A069P1H1_9BURK|nr:hypothetical protein BG57_06280 [Caballeronia grimmiae]
MRRSGGDRPLLGQTARRRSGDGVRLADGPLRRDVADRASPADRHASGCGPGKGQSHDGEDAGDDQARYRGAGAGVSRRVISCAGSCAAARSACSP